MGWGRSKNAGADHVKRSVFGPDRYIANVNTAFGGREPERDIDLFMQERLQISQFLPEIIEDDERSLKRVDVGNKNFPHSKLKVSEDRFRETWVFS
jgi:hypothetical protein